MDGHYFIYTPGPWVWRQIHGFGANIFLYSVSPKGYPYNEWCYIAQDISGVDNACLIEKPPELYEALEQLVKVLGRIGWDDPAYRQAWFTAKQVLETVTIPNRTKYGNSRS